MSGIFDEKTLEIFEALKGPIPTYKEVLEYTDRVSRETTKECIRIATEMGLHDEARLLRSALKDDENEEET